MKRDRSQSYGVVAVHRAKLDSGQELEVRMEHVGRRRWTVAIWNGPVPLMACTVISRRLASERYRSVEAYLEELKERGTDDSGKEVVHEE